MFISTFSDNIQLPENGKQRKHSRRSRVLHGGRGPHKISVSALPPLPKFFILSERGKEKMIRDYYIVLNKINKVQVTRV